MSAVYLLFFLEFAPVVEFYLLMTLNPMYLRMVCRWSVSPQQATGPSRAALASLDTCEVGTGKPLRLRRCFAMGPKVLVGAWLDEGAGDEIKVRFAPFGLSFMLIALGFTVTAVAMLATGTGKLSLWHLALMALLPPLMVSAVLAYWVGLARRWVLLTLGEAEDYSH